MRYSIGQVSFSNSGNVKFVVDEFGVLAWKLRRFSYSLLMECIGNKNSSKHRSVTYRYRGVHQKGR
jgi:hypothetical protein